MGVHHELGIESTATFVRHPIHSLLVPFPIASFVGALITDIVFLATKGHFWSHASYWLLIAGFVTGLAAGAAGTVDYLTISSVRRMKTAEAHALGNGLVIILALLNLGLRLSDQEVQIAGWGLALSIVTVALMGITGFLGGALSYKYHIGAISPAHGGVVPREEAVDLLRGRPEAAVQRRS